MWRTLALASAFFPGLFAFCIRLLRWAVPGWSLKDRILLSGRYGRDRREVTRSAAVRCRHRAGTGSDPDGPRAPSPGAGSCKRGGRTPSSAEPRPPRGAGAGGGSTRPNPRYPPGERGCSGAAPPLPAGNRAELPLIHGRGRDETLETSPRRVPG